jgi:DNA repair exonuclease SbcCD ATPase subunit
MSSLREKAKERIELACGLSEKNQYDLWVRLEDAEELEQKVKNLETDRDNLLKSLHTCTQNLNSYAKESVELKQKLQQLFKEIEPFIIDLDGSKQHFRKKFEELLKEVKT